MEKELLRIVAQVSVVVLGVWLLSRAFGGGSQQQKPLTPAGWQIWTAKGDHFQRSPVVAPMASNAENTAIFLRS